MRAEQSEIIEEGKPMTNTAGLKDGFDWVREGDKWEVMKVVCGHCFLHGYEIARDLINLDEIDPRPIKRDNGGE